MLSELTTCHWSSAFEVGEASIVGSLISVVRRLSDRCVTGLFTWQDASTVASNIDSTNFIRFEYSHLGIPRHTRPLISQSSRHRLNFGKSDAKRRFNLVLSSA
jgi:hypothetical protein